MSEVAEGPETSVIARGGVASAAGEAARAPPHRGDDLHGAYDTDVGVGQQREQAAARRPAAIEADRAGLRDRGGAAGHGAVEAGDFRWRKPVVLDKLDSVGPPRRIKSRRHRDAPGAERGERLGDRLGSRSGAMSRTLAP